MMDHYYGDNMKSLCCERDKIEEVLKVLTTQDLENIRQLPSFRPFVEAQHYETQIQLFEDDSFFKEILCRELNKLHDYLNSFYICVRLLTLFVKDLPQNLLGKTVNMCFFCIVYFNKLKKLFLLSSTRLEKCDCVLGKTERACAGTDTFALLKFEFEVGPYF